MLFKMRIFEVLTESTFMDYSQCISTTPNLRDGIKLNVRSNFLIYDITGRKVETLVSSPQSQGSYQVGWSGTDEAGRQVAGGMYFARLQAGANSMVVKMLYLR